MDNSPENPSVYVSPDSDADDVEGHAKVRGPENRRIDDSADDDVEGHAKHLGPENRRIDDSDDDVEGHNRRL